MVDEGTPHRMVKEHSQFSPPSTYANETASSEITHEQTEESQELLLKTFPSDALQLETICQTGEQHFQELAFVVGHTGKEKALILTVTQQVLYFHPHFGYTSRSI